MKIVYVGNFIEFLEFSLFSALLPIITKELFNYENASDAALFGYLLFFIGFLGRPFGALIFGYLGDRIGRKNALFTSVTGMSLATFCLGMVPAGEWAPVLLAMARLMQGVFTGGEYANASVYVVENAPINNRYKSAANLTASGIFGAAAGQVIGSVTALNQFAMLSWRYAFVIVALLSLYVAVCRLKVVGDSYQEIKHEAKKLSKAFIPYVLLGILFGGIMNGLFYLIYTFLGTYQNILADKISFSFYFSSLISSILLGGALLFWSRQRFINTASPTKLLKISLVGMSLLIYPMYVELSKGDMSLYTLAIQVAFILFMQLFTVVVLRNFPEQFPRENRVFYSGVSISIGNSILGGASPYVSAKLVALTGSLISPVIFFLGLFVIVYVFVSMVPLKQTEQELA